MLSTYPGAPCTVSPVESEVKAPPESKYTPPPCGESMVTLSTRTVGTGATK